MNKRTKNILSIFSIILLIGILVISAVGNFFAFKYSPIISTYLGHKNFEVENSGGTADTEYYKRSYLTEEERLAADSKAGKEAAGEGIVLLKNNSLLPLSKSSKVTLLGVGSASILYGGGGSGAVDTGQATNVKDALEKSGFQVNPVAWDFYTTGPAKNIKMDVPDIAGTGRYVIHEAPTDLFTQKEVQSFQEYNDVAVVTISRSGGESSDLPMKYDESYLEPMDIKGYAGQYHSNPLDSKEDVGKHYLELTTREQDLLKYAKKNFKKVILVLNSANPIELGFIDKEEFDIDAVLWIGNPGQDGLYALGDILNGDINPSGKLVNAYAYNPLSAPATINFGKNNVEMEGTRGGVNYVVYQEGVYVGYKYYETRYEDTVLNQGNAKSKVGVTSVDSNAWNYDNEVQFPFGYGLSYTTFDKKFVELKSHDNEYTVEVTITNTGSNPGKEVAQIYMQMPYTEYDRQNKIEKVSVQLAGFAKTKELKPGESQTLQVSIPKNILRTYDSNNGGQYLIEEGNYYFTVANNSHDAIKQILAKKGEKIPNTNDNLVKDIKISKTEKIQKSENTGKEISNQFQDADIKTYDPNFEYLSRNDWEKTYPKKYELILTDEMKSLLSVPKGTDKEGEKLPETDVQSGLSLVMMREVEFDDPLWDTFLNQLKPEEMYNLVRIGGYQTQSIPSVGVPATVHVDGPAYVGVAGLTGVKKREKTYAWPSEILLASSWNADILYGMGQLIGEDALAQGDLNFAGWYAPAMNIHRTAFSGRNFEYYSEDSLLSARLGASTTKGATEKGVITFIKHFALNDQETSRASLVTFANEQTIREIYLTPFEESIKNGNALGVMAGMNRVGLKWAGNHEGLMTNVLRNEWNFKGTVVTDQASFPQAFPFMEIRGGLEAGTDLYLNTGTDNWQIEGYESNPTVMNQLRNATKHILYSVSRSFAMNGLSSDSKVKKVTPLWQIWMYIADVIIVFLCGFGIYFASKKINFKRVAE